MAGAFFLVERQAPRLTPGVLVANQHHDRRVDAFEIKQVVEGQCQITHRGQVTGTLLTGREAKPGTPDVEIEHAPGDASRRPEQPESDQRISRLAEADRFVLARPFDARLPRPRGVVHRRQLGTSVWPARSSGMRSVMTRAERPCERLTPVAAAVRLARWRPSGRRATAPLRRLRAGSPRCSRGRSPTTLTSCSRRRAIARPLAFSVASDTLVRAMLASRRHPRLRQ